MTADTLREIVSKLMIDDETAFAFQPVNRFEGDTAKAIDVVLSGLAVVLQFGNRDLLPAIAKLAELVADCYECSRIPTEVEINACIY